MERKYYPPHIEGTLPAFFKDDKIIVPFAMNKTVGWNEIDGFAIKIKNIQNSQLIGTLIALKEQDEYDEEKYEVFFDTSSIIDKLEIGVSYKIQMCYINENKKGSYNYGYYSTVGIAKCTQAAEIKIEGLKKNVNNTNIYTYIGVYNQQEGDPTEKVYSYHFTIYNDEGKIIETSGELLHNHENNDSIYQTEDSYTITKNLLENETYTIEYVVTTTNNTVQYSPQYQIIENKLIETTLDKDIKLITSMNEENGYVLIQLENKDKDGNEISISKGGYFTLSRASNEDNYETWFQLDDFVIYNNDLPSTCYWKDCTVQHGYSYKYSIQQYSKKHQKRSKRIVSDEIMVAFEHCYLSDGNKQLKIKFNPKIGALKDTILESKTNTLGGKFPFFFRNGNVQYKEFSISGLVSYLSDEEQLFLTNNELKLDDVSQLKRLYTLKSDIKSTDTEYFNSLDAVQSYQLQELYHWQETSPDSHHNLLANKKTRTTSLTDYNMLAERIFKTEVLKFLNNGKPKLFRSPAEGNYIVRLTNSSLSPDDKLSRMLHTFSATATEIDDFTWENLNKYSLKPVIEGNRKQVEIIYTKDEAINEEIAEIDILEYSDLIQSIRCFGLNTDDVIKIRFANNNTKRIEIDSNNPLGIYENIFDFPPLELYIYTNSQKGTIEFSYYNSTISNAFDKKG